MDIRERILRYTSGISELYKMLPIEIIEKIVNVLLEAYENNKKVITFGNGGHGCTASHMINDLAKHTIVSDKKNEVIVKGKRFKTTCLNDNMATSTSWANDVSWEASFSEQLQNWAEGGDVVIRISGSGNSENILQAFRVAKERQALTIAFTGYDGGKIKNIADICFIVPSDDIAFIEDVRLSLAHLVCNIIRTTLKERYANNEINSC